MKNILGGIFIIFAFFEVVAIVGAATYQPQSLGLVDIAVSSGTLAEICASTPTMVGKPRWCTNCAAAGGAGTVVWSTSTAAPGAGCDFVLSSGTQAK